MNLTINARNTSNMPYNLQSDLIKVKITIFEDYNNSYLLGIPVDVYCNFEGIDILIGTYMTNAFGIINFTYNTNYIIDKTINTGQIWCKFSYNGNKYISNKTRINFIYDIGEVEVIIIILDANTTTTRLSNPSGYLIVDANDVTTRLSNPNNYTVYTREFF